MFAVGYAGMLLLLIEISFVLKDYYRDHHYSYLIVGGFYGCIVLVLLVGSSFTGTCRNYRCVCGYKCNWIICSNNCRPFINVSLICFLFGVCSFVAFTSLFDCRFAFGDGLSVSIEEGNEISQIRLAALIFAYVCLFGCMIQPLISTFTIVCPESAASVFSLILHFWRNLIACTGVVIVLNFRKYETSFKPNWLDLAIGCCALVIFLIFYLWILPIWCCNCYKYNAFCKCNKCWNNSSDNESQKNKDEGAKTYEIIVKNNEMKEKLIDNMGLNNSQCKEKRDPESSNTGPTIADNTSLFHWNQTPRTDVNSNKNENDTAPNTPAVDNDK